MKDFADVKGIIDIPYSRVQDMEYLIAEWKVLNNNKALPREFFDLSDIEKMISWLEKNV